MALDEFAHFFTEAKLSSKQRNKLDDSQFGIPELRKYPLTDEKHVLQAVRFFNKAEEKYKPGLARRIVKRAKELDMEWENWDVLKPYLSKGKHIKEYAESLSDTPEAVKCLEELNKANVKYDKATPNTWKLKSPESVIRNKKGNCHDISYYVYKNLDKFAKKKVGKGILFVMEYKDGSEKGGVTHSVCYEKIKGGVCFIEYSWEDLRGTFPRNNIREEIDVIKHNWKFSTGFDKLFFAEIKNVDKLHPGMTLDQYVKVATSNKEIISEAYAYDAITGEKIDLGPSTMTEEELRSRMIHNNDFTSGTVSDRDEYTYEPDDCYCESGKPWYNDKGLRVPDKCVVCDAPIKVYLRGEPVYLCSNKKCGKYYGTVPCNVNESGDINGLVNANMIASKIHEKYESDKKEPIGNQNCQLCTWCAEAQFRGKDVLPRPIYSPRDPALEIKGDDIVINPERISIKSGFDDFLFKITETPYSRWYCHVKWKDGNGGHEFLLLNIDGKPYLMDPQQGLVDKLLETHSYIKDTDWNNSYICRMDDKEFNKKLFNEYNDPSKVVPWDAKLDIPFMVKEGLLSPEEAEEYFKKYPDASPQNNGKYLTYEYLNKMFPDGNPIQESTTVALPEGIWMRPAVKGDRDYILMVEMETLDDEFKKDQEVLDAIKKDAYESVHKTRIICHSKSETEAETIGLIQSYQKDDYWYIGEIYLNPEFRGKGIGRAILEKEISEHDWLSLDVSKNNKHAIDLYLSLGFKIIDQNKYGYRMDLKKQPIQEGAWNDIKRGVNPYSKKTWFHVSLSPLHEGKVFKPRIPEYLELTKQGKDDPYYEDMEIPRVCFSPSIEGAIHAITAGFKRIETAGKELYVYIPEKPIDQYKHMTNKEIVDKKLVFDAKYTKECWILEPVKLFLYGTIVIDQVSNHKAKPTANNKGQVSDVSYKWHWQTKPRVIKGMGHEYFYEPDEDEKKSKKSKSIKEAYNMSDFERDPSVFRMFMEADTDKDDDKKEDTDKKSSSDKNDDEEGDAIISVSTTEVTTTTDDVDDFGTDAGNGEQNQYDPKEVEYLNKLIASEADAISEYFEYGKLTRVPVLSKLYTDIGDEERFHLEQLIYAKSTLTGEKYEPKDSKVRREYEELLELGMDEETAMTTAIDKTHLMPEEEEFTEEEIEEMALVSQMSEMMSFHTEIVLESMIDKSDIRSSLYEANQAFMEQAFFMEEVSNLATKQGQKQLGSKNPISAIWGLFKSIYRVIINLIKKAKLAFQKRRLKNKKKWAWIKKHGITALFKNGVSLFFWNDQTNKYEVSDALAYLKMFWDTCSMICEKANIKENVPEEKFEIKQMIDLLSKDVEFKQMRIKSLGDAIQKINGTSLSKSKMLVNDNNQNELAELFFGYTDEKYGLMEREGENSKNIDISKNIYNKMNILLDAFAKCSEYVGVVIEKLAELEGKPNTIYQNNPKLYNECVTAAGAVTKGLNRFNSAISYDLSEIMKIDNGLNELVSKADESGDKTELNEFKAKQAEAAAEAKKNEKEAKDAGKHGYSVPIK